MKEFKSGTLSLGIDDIGNTKLQARIVGPQSEVVAAVSAMDGVARVLPLGEKTDIITPSIIRCP